MGVSLQLGSFSVVLQILASGVTQLPFNVFVLAMQPIHLAIGVVEGLITASVLLFIIPNKSVIRLQNNSHSTYDPFIHINDQNLADFIKHMHAYNWWFSFPMGFQTS